MEAIPIAEGVTVHPQAIPLRFTCGEAFVEERWVPPWEIIDVGEEVTRIAEEHVEHHVVPNTAIRTSPPANILVGISTWFWVDGWDGSPITETAIAPWGDAVTITMSLDHVRWTFGDGSPPLIGDLGLAHPAESTVQHLYTHRSTSRNAPDAAYSVSARIQINVTYVFEGETFEADPIIVTHTAPAIVRQLQAVIS